MKAIGKLKCPERSFSYSGPGMKTLSAVSWMCKATPWGWGHSGAGIPELAEGSGKAENSSGHPGNLCG